MSILDGKILKNKAQQKPCSVPSCPDKTDGCVIMCGGCKRSAHVTCAQTAGSGWHLQMIETRGEDDGGLVETLCPDCGDVEIVQNTRQTCGGRARSSSYCFTLLHCV